MGKEQIKTGNVHSLLMANDVSIGGLFLQCYKEKDNT